jgi:hypothetical protein
VVKGGKAKYALNRKDDPSTNTSKRLDRLVMGSPANSDQQTAHQN